MGCGAYVDPAGPAGGEGDCCGGAEGGGTGGAQGGGGAEVVEVGY